MDLTQILEELVLVLVSIELVELAYHIYAMRRYEKHTEEHLIRMDAHMKKMDQYMKALENNRISANTSFDPDKERRDKELSSEKSNRGD